MWQGLVGLVVGVVIMSLVQINKHNDKYLEEIHKDERK
jgi:CHASE3 domain sensor protein